VVVGLKTEVSANGAGTHDPVVHIDDWIGNLTLIAPNVQSTKYLTGDPEQAVILRESGTNDFQITVIGARHLGYEYLYKDEEDSTLSVRRHAYGTFNTSFSTQLNKTVYIREQVSYIQNAGLVTTDGTTTVEGTGTDFVTDYTADANPVTGFIRIEGSDYQIASITDADTLVTTGGVAAASGVRHGSPAISQTESLLDLQNSDGSTITKIKADGSLLTGGAIITTHGDRGLLVRVRPCTMDEL
jgi:hypothetical protein